MKNQAADALTFLGFSEIEALVYCHLLQESPATGYRVSHAIGKPTANTYKAIAALALRGAIIIDDSESRLCRAVPPSELLDRLKREFEGHKQTAESELGKIRQAEGDDRVYQLTSIAQVFERARAMLDGAKQAVMLDAFPHALGQLTADLLRAAKRGVKIAVRAYEPARIGGVAIVVTDEAARVRAAWPGEQLSMAADGDQFLTALLSKDAQSVHQAVWSNSTFLSCLQYNALHGEIVSTDMRLNRRGDSTLEALSLTRLKPMGFLKLNERYGDAASARRRKKATS
ncbi:MAG: TrmB family transcriptional regulator [Alphaproteobacteria bacterium]|nr:TrmB family transcriptional regulator [Alphaproteobacteria bacterium]